jgi:hypothetical protein
VATAAKFIVNSSPYASIKTNGVEEARQKGGKDRGKGIAARSRSRSQRKHRKESVSMASFLLCADFGPPIFEDDKQLPPSFTLAAFDFLRLGGSQWFVNATAAEQGLQFPPQGAEITLPCPVRRVRLRIGTFNGPVDIEARDASGSTVSQLTVPGLNQYVNRNLSGPDKVIESVVLTQGGNEGILVRICVISSCD